MERYQEHKALILNYYRELESANADTVGNVIQEYVSSDIDWYGVYPFNLTSSVAAKPLQKPSGALFFPPGPMCSVAKMYFLRAPARSITPTG